MLPPFRELPETVALHVWEVRPLQEPVTFPDRLLEDVERPCPLPLEQEKRVEQVRVLPLLQDVEDYRDVPPDVERPVCHHKERVL